MASHNRTLHLIASKLGLDEDDKVMGKAGEFERLLQTKTIAGNNMSDTSKVVICLDLAAGLLGAGFDLKSAIKYSGLRPSLYNNSKKMVQNLLELDTSKLTTSILCAALQCTGVQELADRILDEYQKQAKMEIDLNLPQYVCMAVYHACRISKVKVSKVKINEKSRLKPAQWAKLDEDWSKFVDENFAGPKKKRGRPPKNDENIDPEPMDIDIPQKENPTEPEFDEPYKDWKRRMLELAYKEVAELEKQELNKKDSRSDLEYMNINKKKLRVDVEKLANVKDLRVNVEKLAIVKDLRVDVERLANVKDLRADVEKLAIVEKDLRVDIGKAKKRILKVQAARVNEDVEDEQRMEREATTPRRSPRKTPQKYSPYKSPQKEKGVRLLFYV